MATLFILVFFIILILLRCLNIWIINHKEKHMNKLNKFGYLSLASCLETIWTGLISVGAGLVDGSSITGTVVLDKHPYTIHF